MSREVRPSAQVIEFSRRLAPEPRRAIKKALAGLARDQGDIRALEAPLSDYYRLRVGRYRIVFRYARKGDVEVVFVEERQLVYELFEAEFIRRLKR